MRQPLISIIVPIYKVEPYLRKCVDSILAQTYTNIEVILINDGSPDGCPAICDEYAAKDRRVIAIHQQNAGVSAARNAGLDAANGEYIAFVDSDDWIEPDMYEALYHVVEASGADIVGSSYCGNCDKSEKMGVDEYQTFSAEEAIRKILNGQFELLYVWGRLYVRKVVERIRFLPSLKQTEDGLFVVQAIANSNTIAYVNYPYYRYVVRDDSSCHAFGDEFWDTFTAIDEIVGVIKKQGENFAAAADKCALEYGVNTAKAAETKGRFTRFAYGKTVAHIRRYWNPDSCRLLSVRTRCWIRLLLLGRGPFIGGRKVFRRLSVLRSSWHRRGCSQ